MNKLTKQFEEVTISSSVLDLAKKFNQTTQYIIGRIEKKSTSEIEKANLDRLRKRIKLAKQTLGDEVLLVESSPFFIEYSEQILEEDMNVRDKFFMTMDIRAEYKKRKGEVTKQDEFIFSLTESIRSHYRSATQAEKDEVYANVKILFECCVEYLLIITED